MDRVGGGDQAPEPELQAKLFTVGDKPYCVWDWDLERRNLEYLESLDPHYFRYVARANYPNLRADDPKERQRAATAIRVAYHHGLEQTRPEMAQRMAATGSGRNDVSS